MIWVWHGLLYEIIIPLSILVKSRGLQHTLSQQPRPSVKLDGWRRLAESTHTPVHGIEGEGHVRHFRAFINRNINAALYRVKCRVICRPYLYQTVCPEVNLSFFRDGSAKIRPSKAATPAQMSFESGAWPNGDRRPPSSRSVAGFFKSAMESIHRSQKVLVGARYFGPREAWLGP